ncbi:hypothetical protein M422DRAFT_229527 [Sphaerobolus stellatus SS14]|uniref:Protein-S-isoprenylcysteine O-methyltransferase n=1 Tax=Sphaerobolus stellatus (strain SS14) TaxID=990650 RepID=A0A0C9VJD0_SPHS4|nr:hypothetical protein M422DRAFT_229527 [Sphaerobolus stellatus SS14]
MFYSSGSVGILLSITLRLTCAVWFYKGARPPQPPATKQDKVNKSTLFERYVKFSPYVMTLPFVCLMICESVSIFATEFLRTSPFQKAASILCPSRTHQALRTFPSSTVIAFTFIAIGRSIREACYSSLGKFFTIEIAIRPNHELVDTGPYGIVRHPSYTGGIFLVAGGILAGIGSDSYLNSCGWMSTSILLNALALSWAAYTSFLLYSLLRRGPVEDHILYERFGKDWESYARRVPYMYIPGII